MSLSSSRGFPNIIDFGRVSEKIMSTDNRSPIPQPEFVVVCEWAVSWFDLSTG